jgi:hypothetical protein
MAQHHRPLAQQDLTHLRLQEMSPAERAELRRRYAAFIAHFGNVAPVPRPAASPRRVRKWVPGKRAPLEGA